MAIICDIDGTLLANGVRPIKNVIQHVNAMRPVYLVTGRPESERTKTEMALHAAGVKYAALYMCPDAKTGNQTACKLANAKRVPNPSMAIDNDAAMRAAYQHLGIKVIDPTTLH